MEETKAKEDYNLELEILYSTLRRTHRDFIKEMYSEFGHPKPPREIIIICEEEDPSFFKMINGMRGYDDHITYLGEHKRLNTLNFQISIGCEGFKEAVNARKQDNSPYYNRGNMRMISFPITWVDYMHKVQSNCIHESSHYLHFLSSTSLMKEKLNGGYNPYTTRFIEFVADLGSLTYFCKKNQLHLILPNELKLGSSLLEMFLTAYCSFKSDPTLLRKIINMNLNDGMALVDEYIKKYHPDSRIIEKEQKKLQIEQEDTIHDDEPDNDHPF